MQFTVTHTFKASPVQLYAAWLDSKQHAAMTGAEADVSNKVGEEFSAWDGYITGRNLELEPNKRIKQAWRTSEFAEDQPDSIIEITFKELAADKTELTLTHSELPDSDTQYIDGWGDSYFTPMKEYFDK